MKWYADNSEKDPRYYEFCLVWCEYSACEEPNIAYLTDDGKWLSEETDEELPVTKWMPMENL